MPPEDSKKIVSAGQSDSNQMQNIILSLAQTARHAKSAVWTDCVQWHVTLVGVSSQRTLRISNRVNSSRYAAPFRRYCSKSRAAIRRSSRSVVLIVASHPAVRWKPLHRNNMENIYCPLVHVIPFFRSCPCGSTSRWLRAARESVKIVRFIN